MQEEFEDTEIMNENNEHPYELPEKTAIILTWAIIILFFMFLIIATC